MKSGLEERGFFWWWTDSTEDKETAIQTAATGILNVDDKGSIELKLDRPLAHPSLRILLGNVLPSEEMLIGRLSDSGKHVLLKNLQVMNFTIGEQGSGSDQYSAQICLESYSEIDPAVHEYDHLKIELSGLDDWLKLASLTYTQNTSDTVEVNYERLSYEYPTEDFFLSIESLTSTPLSLYFKGPFKKLSFEQTSWLKYRPSSKLDCDSSRLDCTRLEEFFSILLGSYFQLDWPHLIYKSGESEVSCKMYSFRGTVPVYEPNQVNTLTRFSSIQEAFGELFSGWCENREKYGPGYYLYIAGLRKSDIYAEHRFVNLIWALESLHRQKTSNQDKEQSSERVLRILSKFQDTEDRSDLKWLRARLKYAEEPTLEDRIFQSFESLPIPLDIAALRRFALKCQQRRNQISHTGGPPESETFSTFHEDISRLSEALTFLYHALLLKELGLSDDLLCKAYRDSFVARSRILPAFQAFSLIQSTN